MCLLKKNFKEKLVKTDFCPSQVGKSKNPSYLLKGPPPLGKKPSVLIWDATQFKGNVAKGTKMTRKFCNDVSSNNDNTMIIKLH